MFHQTTRGRHAKRRAFHPDPAVQACACSCAAAAAETQLTPAEDAPRALTGFGQELLGADDPWRPTSLGVLGPDFMAQRPRIGAPAAPQAPAPTARMARIVSFQPSHAVRPALKLHDPIRVKSGVRHYGGQFGTIIQFNCTAAWPIGTQLADGQIVFFAPDEVDPAPIADTLVMPALDVDDMVLMGGAR